MKTEDLYQIFRSYPIICTDSRNIIPGSLFFALKGEYFNGNRFAAAAIDKGAAYAIVDDPLSVVSGQHIFVPDVLTTLQQLARHHRLQAKLTVIAITGSNGKTTTKELITAVLGSHYQTIATTGNLNNHVGVPLTLLRIVSAHEMAVVEMGANHVGEINSLCELALPTHGIITNIGHAHLEGFGSFEGVVQAKTELYRHIQHNAGILFVDSDNALLNHHAQDTDTITYGLNLTAVYRGEITGLQPFLKVRWSEKESEYELQSKLVGSYNFKNILAAISVGRHFEVPAEKIIRAIESYTPSNNRSQVVITKHNTLILDAYNANPSSMSAAIENFKSYTVDHKICILGDMLELGSYTHNEHQKIMDLLESGNFETVMLVGEYFYEHRHTSPYNYFLSIVEAGEWLQNNNLQHKTILIKGSRKIQLENLLPHL
ncbi:MAG: UDP-N-acetylmuramoyl-tripeptide--D-alanyl-D-alanine ligase [Bacteroidales bacterium]|nr:UDP-N-acetylmuramoyl-tripeptide--D-alanyl-D-alanine ligase [Bacteroidales bacterium]MDZ4203913.1 UDP-N-acetylmuramoyl-tripeptide--D-alanyl-D-alanine ligase [Bacteroidales bacterium]